MIENVRSITSLNSAGDLNVLTGDPPGVGSAWRGSVMAPCGQASRARVTETPTIHLHPTAPLAERVLLPGDPGRALMLAQALLRKPVMFNHNRGLWGYTGVAADGLEVTIQSTGMGGPSAAIVISELAQLGARALVRVGTCGALDRSLELGQLLVVTEAIPADGASQALGATGSVMPDPRLLAALIAAAGEQARTGKVVSTDLFYDERPSLEEQWAAAGAAAVEMETATLFSLATRRGLAAASVVLVSDLAVPGGERERIDADVLHAAELALGRLALRGLAAL
jgi:uridine phosphorylase